MSRASLTKRLIALLGSLGLLGGVVLLPTSARAASGAANTGGPVSAPVFSPALNEVGQTNLTQLGAAAAKDRRTARSASASSGGFRTVDNALLTHQPSGSSKGVPTAPTTPLSTDNVPGERGFAGLTGVAQASTKGGLDLEPPDQGLCAGGGYVMEFINNALTVYSSFGGQLLQPIGSPALFLQPTTAFFSDPRCYYDASTQRWFIQEFIVGTTNANGGLASPSVQFLAVSDSPDPTADYHVYSFDTSDVSTPGCPCFGDYDELGADANGIYITTDEFGISTPAYNGVIMYALSKALVETFPQTGILPTVFGYRLTSDPFGQPYIVAPASSPPGARFAKNTEYFVESNGDAISDDHLVVYALRATSLLAAVPPTPPPLFLTQVATQRYSQPTDALQKAGPRPLGAQYQAPAGGIQADFDAEMEPVYTAGKLYCQLDTLTAGKVDGVAWFILSPSFSSKTLSATVAAQGLVTVSGTSLLYPYTAVNKAGKGYLLFSLSGKSNYPSPAYISYGSNGPTGPVIVATPGAAPDDGFTCYAAFVGPDYGGCRWGDYSMGVVMGNRVYMAAEMIPPSARDLLTNWGTFIWSAPPR